LLQLQQQAYPADLPFTKQAAEGGSGAPAAAIGLGVGDAGLHL